MVDSLDFIASTVAILFGPEFQPKSPVPGQEIGKFMHRPILNISPEGATVLTSHRDQIEVLLAGNKLDVRDVSGRGNTAHERIPTVLHGICPIISNDKPRSYGINFVVSTPNDNPTGWIAERFLNQDLCSIVGSPIGSNGVSVVFERANKIITVRFDPGPESTIMVNFNASQVISELPKTQAMATDIEAQHGRLLKLLAALEA
jgi:hypothetical protein